MDSQLVSTLAQIAGIGGAALGVFLLVFRDVIRKNVFPQLTKRQGFQLLILALVLTWSVAIAGILAWVFGPQPQDVAASEGVQIHATLWGVELDDKGAALASTQLQIDDGGAVEPDDLTALTDWLSAELGVAGPTPPNVTVTLDIPADLVNEAPTIERSDDGPLDVRMWLVQDDKIRLPLDRELLASLNQDFHLEIEVPGYGATAREVKWGEALVEEIALSPTTVSVGIEPFTGDGPAITEMLIGALLDNERLKVLDPTALARTREEIREHNARIVANPSTQLALRKLSISRILSGTTQRIPSQN